MHVVLIHVEQNKKYRHCTFFESRPTVAASVPGFDKIILASETVSFRAEKSVPQTGRVPYAFKYQILFKLNLLFNCIQLKLSEFGDRRLHYQISIMEVPISILIIVNTIQPV